MILLKLQLCFFNLNYHLLLDSLWINDVADACDIQFYCCQKFVWIIDYHLLFLSIMSIKIYELILQYKKHVLDVG